MNRIAPLLLLLTTACFLPHLTHAASKPNIVIIYADDLGYGDLDHMAAMMAAIPRRSCI